MSQKLTEKGQRDYQLIQQALKNGDQHAYAELMHHYRDSLYFTMLKMTGDQHDADDLTIEAFGKAFKNLNQYTSEYAFSTWLFKIATNNCIDFIRRKKNKNISIDNPIESDGSSSLELQSNSPGPYDSLIKKEKVKLLHSIIKELKPRYQELIDLRYFKEYSYDEISKNLNLPLGTVKAQLFRARELLYNILKKTDKDF